MRRPSVLIDVLILAGTALVVFVCVRVDELIRALLDRCAGA